MRLNHGAYILARYSTDNQDQDSIEVQVEKCSSWCEKESIPVLDVFADFAVSGMKDTRPQYERMMTLLQQGGADTVVIYDQSRMFRKMTAWFQFRDELENLGVRVVSVTQPMIGGDLMDPANFLAEGSMALFNQMWVLQTRQKVVEKMRYMARNGQFTGGPPPLGYRVEDQKLAIDPDEAEIVRRIFAMYMDGKSYRQIVQLMNSQGIRTRRGSDFGANSIHDILKNKKYIGTLVYGKTAQKPNGTRNSHRTSPNVIEIENGCPAIIEKEMFEAVQKKMEARKRTGGRTPTRDDFTLRKKVFCGECNSPMHIHYSGSKTNYVYYLCTAQKRTHVCQNKPIRADWLEEEIARRLREAIGTPSDRSRLLEILRKQRETVQSGAGERMEALVRRRREITTKLENASDAILQGLTSKTLMEKVQALEAEKATLDYQIDMHHKEVEQVSLSDKAIEEALDTILESASTDNAAILSIVYRVEVHKDIIKVWTILDCSPDGHKTKNITIPTAALPEPPAGDSLHNCSNPLGSTISNTQIIICLLIPRK